jgi:hypothetical protein
MVGIPLFILISSLGSRDATTDKILSAEYS